MSQLHAHENRASIHAYHRPEEQEIEELLTVAEVSQRLRVDDTTTRRWIKSGALEAITLPHRGKRQAYRIKKSTLDALLNPPGKDQQ